MFASLPRSFLLPSAGFLLLSVVWAGASVQPNALFSDCAVLQQGKPLPVWGTASPGEKVTVVLSGVEPAATTADAEGMWRVVLPVQAASAEPKELVIKGENEVRLKDILIGEVWIGSGQSNMEFRLPRSSDWERVKKAAGEGAWPLIRLFEVPNLAADSPPASVNSQWEPVTEKTAEQFSAALFYFAEALQKARPGVPIGLISASVGGTNSLSWISSDAFRNTPALRSLVEKYDADLANLPKLQQRYENMKKKYEERKQGLSPEEVKKLVKPLAPPSPDSPKRPGGYYAGMIAPLAPYAIRGVLWYQGEADGGRNYIYGDIMKTLASSWRAEWEKQGGAKELGEFAFFQAQLPNYDTPQNFVKKWVDLRQAQFDSAREIPNAGIICLIDCGDPADIHPKNKTPVGERYSRLARAMVYGEDITPASPSFKNATFGASSAEVEFDNAGKGLKSSDGQPLRYFEVADETGIFHPATAEIKGAGIEVSAPGVKPVAVRYAWRHNPVDVNFFSAEDLPVFPFSGGKVPSPAPAAPAQNAADPES